MVTIREELPGDLSQRESLLDHAFGKNRRRKTSQRLRQGRIPSDGLSFSAVDETGRLVGTIRLWDVVAGSAGPALLLGPLAVDCRQHSRGIGGALMERALHEARLRGHDAVLLVGDQSYYGSFGFTPDSVTGLRLPGPVEQDRFLGLELKPGALQGAQGLVRAGGRLQPVHAKAA